MQLKPCFVLNLESMNVAVAFIDQAGAEITDGHDVWIGGELMPSIVSFNQRKVRFVVDKAVGMKPGWSAQTIQVLTYLLSIIKSIYYHYLPSYEFPCQNVLTRPISFVFSF